MKDNNLVTKETHAYGSRLTRE